MPSPSAVLWGRGPAHMFSCVASELSRGSLEVKGQGGGLSQLLSRRIIFVSSQCHLRTAVSLPRPLIPA